MGILVYKYIYILFGFSKIRALNRVFYNISMRKTRKRKVYRVPEKMRKKLGRKLSPKIRERIKKEIKQREHVGSAKLPDFRIITTKGKELVYHGVGYDFSRVVSKGGITRKTVDVWKKAIPYPYSTRDISMKERFRDQKKLFEMGLPVTKPLRLRVRKGK